MAQELCNKSFADKVFFCNSGAEATEGLIKLARKYHHIKGDFLKKLNPVYETIKETKKKLSSSRDAPTVFYRN